MLKMVPTAELTSMLEDRIFGRDRNHVLVLFRAHHADPARVIEAILDGLVGEDVELLLLFALNVSMSRGSQDVDQAGSPDRGGDDLGGEGDVVEQVGELARGLRVAVLLVHDESLDGGHRCLHAAPDSVGSESWEMSYVSSESSPRTVRLRPSVVTETLPCRSVRRMAMPA